LPETGISILISDFLSLAQLQREAEQRRDKRNNFFISVWFCFCENIHSFSESPIPESWSSIWIF